VFAAIIAGTALQAAPAQAAEPYAVQSGDTLWSLATAQGYSPQTLATYNGLSLDGLLISGQPIEIPTADEGAAALVEAGLDPAQEIAVAAPSVVGSAPVPGLGAVTSPAGPVYLDAGAAEAWNAMRADALSTYGIDIYPGGDLSGYRSTDEQAELYGLFLAGLGAPSHPPGHSAHELGLALDLASPEMRTVIDEIGPAYGWAKVEAPDEWWHVNYVGG